MWFRTPFDALKARSSRKSARQMQRPRLVSRPRVEALEDRTVPSFNPAVNYPIGINPSAEAVGDFNGDGFMDVATANSGSNNVSMLLGNGDGTFQAARHFDGGVGPAAVAVGELNGDGRLDVVTANADSNTLSVLLGNGDGTFQAARRLGGDRPYDVAIGDFNGDGRADLVFTT